MQQFKSFNDPELVKTIQAGKIGTLPTDTVYGLVAQAGNREAVSRLYAIKYRQKKPGTIIAANVTQLVELGIPRRYLTAVEQFWPGPISIIVPVERGLEYLHLGKLSLACRLPNNVLLTRLIEKTGPLLTTSANHPGEITARTAQEAKSYFADKVDFCVDGGDLSGRQPSTVIRIIDDEIEVLREGAVKIDITTGRIEQ